MSSPCKRRGMDGSGHAAQLHGMTPMPDQLAIIAEGMRRLCPSAEAVLGDLAGVTATGVPPTLDFWLKSSFDWV